LARYLAFVNRHTENVPPRHSTIEERPEYLRKETYFRRGPDLKAIALAAFPKSGVTYLSSLLFYSFFPTAKPEDIEHSYVIDIHGNPWEAAEAHRGRIFLKTHFAYPEHVKAVGQPEKAIYLVRDPLDIMNSAYDFHRLLDNTFAEDRDSFVDRWIASGGGDFDVAGPWTRHADSWTRQSDVPVLVIRYTALVDRPEEELDRIFSFLGFQPEAALIRAAIDNSSMKAMREREEDEFRQKKEGVFYRPFLENTMQNGARFINKGYRSSFEQLSFSQQVAAQRQFGTIVRDYLGTSYSVRNTLIEHGI
jgi:Sulfotransferase domain